MSVEILRKALAAAGHEQALALTNAILPPEEAAEPVQPVPVAGQPMAGMPAPEQVAALAAPAGDGKPQPPPGKAPVQSLDEFEGLSQSERLARMAEADWLMLHGDR